MWLVPRHVGQPQSHPPGVLVVVLGSPKEEEKEEEEEEGDEEGSVTKAKANFLHLLSSHKSMWLQVMF